MNLRDALVESVAGIQQVILRAAAQLDQLELAIRLRRVGDQSGEHRLVRAVRIHVTYYWLQRFRRLMLKFRRMRPPAIRAKDSARTETTYETIEQY
jgi:hypothetical protein